jgi:DNA-binding transcriptional LysR family regulator
VDRLEGMTILLAAVDSGSLSAASRQLSLPLATVSRRVSELEEHLKIRLLLRGSRKLTLTDSGRSYVASCRRILDDIAEAERSAAGEYLTPRGELTISVSQIMGRLHVMPVVEEFLLRMPSYLASHFLKSGLLVPLLEEYEPPLLPANLIYPSQRKVPLKLRAFLDFSLPRLKERIGA